MGEREIKRYEEEGGRKREGGKLAPCRFHTYLVFLYFRFPFSFLLQLFVFRFLSTSLILHFYSFFFFLSFLIQHHALLVLISSLY